MTQRPIDIENVLSLITTMEPARKQELAGKYLLGTLTEEEKKEFSSHIMRAMVMMEPEIQGLREIVALGNR